MTIDHWRAGGPRLKFFQNFRSYTLTAKFCPDKHSLDRYRIVIKLPERPAPYRSPITVENDHVPNSLQPVESRIEGMQLTVSQRQLLIKKLNKVAEISIF